MTCNVWTLARGDVPRRADDPKASKSPDWTCREGDDAWTPVNGQEMTHNERRKPARKADG